MKGTVCMHNWKSKVCHDGRKLCTMGIVLMLAASCCVSSFSLEYPGTVHLCLLWAGEAGLGRKTCLVLLCNEKPQLPPVRRTRRFRQPHGLMQVCIKCRTCPGSTGWDCLPKSLASGCSKVSCCLFFFQELGRKTCSKQSAAKIGTALPYSPGTDPKLSWNFFCGFWLFIL